MSLSTHVLDTALGRPARGVRVLVEVRDSDGWRAVGEAVTDADGRVGDLLGDEPARAGDHRLTFDTAGYQDGRGVDGFYPEVTVTFTVADPSEHHHVPLLLSRYGYCTYRGS